ncbi:MAG: hypothetical protein ABGY95_01740 [Rubritalea sp.]|jgi:hypothetical protein|uniref:hypothetical protein n=1 Tax=Rubritalea sp. TaxID=2109375 RepID=UPI0031C8A919|nr:hypothetical protein [Akkermansiaceae bacterium]
MKNFIPVIILLALAASGCNDKRDEIVSEQKERVTDTIQLGDDIHEAKSKLIDLGFRIDYGPDFPTKSEKYLMMIVDYGVSPSGMETFKYTVGMSGGSGEPIDGIIKATPDGVITSIE